MRCPMSTIAAVAGALLALAGPAAAHVEERSGPFRVELGWVGEPALAGSPNAVEVAVSDASGTAVPVRAGALEVEVSFGGTATTLPLVPAGPRGELHAVIEPTRPGTYAFHVTGSIRGRSVDVRAACGGSTFDCVTDASEIQFPAKDPSPGQVAERLERTLPRADDAADSADGARTIAIVALIAAGIALVGVAAMAVRGRRKSA